MTQLREFAQRSSEFDKLGVSVVALSVDDQEHAHKVWEEAAQRKFTILSDPWSQGNQAIWVTAFGRARRRRHRHPHDTSDRSKRTRDMAPSQRIGSGHSHRR